MDPYNRGQFDPEMDPYNRGQYDSEDYRGQQGFRHQPPPPQRPMCDDDGQGFGPGGEGYRPGGQGYRPGGEGYRPGDGDFPPPPPRFPHGEGGGGGGGGHHHFSDFNDFHSSHKAPDAATEDAQYGGSGYSSSAAQYGNPGYASSAPQYGDTGYSSAAQYGDSGYPSSAAKYGDSGHPSSAAKYGDSSYSSHKGSEAAADLPQGQLVRIFCKENPGFNVAVERGVVMMSAAKAEDESQHWIKDVSYGMRVKDNFGSPAFSLVNKTSKKVLKHAKEQGQQVLLMDYSPGIRDDDILWTESQDFGEGFKTVRAASNTLLNLTIFEGNKRIRNGSALVLDTWHKSDHQLWKVFPL